MNYLKIIKKAKNIALFAHSSPDPDTIGSVIGFYNALLKLGKNVDLFCEDDIPESYSFLEDTIKFNDKLFNKENYDLLIAIDIASSHMFGKFEDDFMSHANTLRIDHHQKGELQAKCNVVEICSACAILIFKIIKKLKIKIDAKIATSLYLAICGDTGLFRNNNTDSETFDVAGKLLENGAEIRRVYGEFFDKKNVSYIKLSSSILLNAKINDEYGFVLMMALKGDYEKFGASTDENVGNLANTYLNCGYKVAVVIKEKDDGLHCSLRSKFEYDCSKIAEKFGGGGHKNASGCKFETTIAEAEKELEKEIINYLENVIV